MRGGREPVATNSDRSGEVELEEVTFGGKRYREALTLRERVLRAPLGVQWTEAEIQAEPADRHFVVLDDGQLVACVVVKDLGDGRVKVRQMAVEPERQGEGIGRRLLLGVEETLAAEGRREVVLHAREVARGFYQRLGYAESGESFLEVGIPHRMMVKALPVAL